MQIRYCPTGDMTADFFTKPLQGSLFKKFRDQILNLAGGSQSPPGHGAPAGVEDTTNTSSDNGGQECVGACNTVGIQHAGGNRQSRIRYDAPTEVDESRRCVTHSQKAYTIDGPGRKRQQTHSGLTRLSQR